jgi:hypothetical protein
MLSPDQSSDALVRMFRKKYIANLDDLFRVLETNSRMSVFRRLKLINYLTSFTDAGHFYTLTEIANFDSLGLWFYRNVGFSRAGTLRSTVIEMVHRSEAGMTPKELLGVLRLRMPNSLHNALRDLVEGKHLRRQRVQGLHLYTSAQAGKAAKQIEERTQKMQSALAKVSPPSMDATIGVLVEALKAGDVLVAPSMVSARLAAKGVIVSIDQVEEIFSRYGLEVGKKTAERA